MQVIIYNPDPKTKPISLNVDECTWLMFANGKENYKYDDPEFRRDLTKYIKVSTKFRPFWELCMISKYKLYEINPTILFDVILYIGMLIVILSAILIP